MKKDVDIGIHIDSEFKLKLPLITIVALGEIIVITLFVILGKYEHGVSIRQSIHTNCTSILNMLVCYISMAWLL